jgi:hypothetical protein
MAIAMQKLSSDRHLGETLAREGHHALENLFNSESYKSSYIRLVEELTP